MVLAVVVLPSCFAYHGTVFAEARTVRFGSGGKVIDYRFLFLLEVTLSLDIGGCTPYIERMLALSVIEQCIACPSTQCTTRSVEHSAPSITAGTFGCDIDNTHITFGTIAC